VLIAIIELNIKGELEKVEYDDIDEKEPLTMGEFVLFMILCAILCIFGYLIGRALLAMAGM